MEQHVDDEILDLYAVGRLPEDLLEEVETHLLICERCRKQVEESDRIHKMLKTQARAPRLIKPSDAESNGDRE
jgi:anti-sigma factor ChrR (cupin superfamily)